MRDDEDGMLGPFYYRRRAVLPPRGVSEIFAILDG